MLTKYEPIKVKGSSKSYSDTGYVLAESESGKLVYYTRSLTTYPFQVRVTASNYVKPIESK